MAVSPTTEQLEHVYGNTVERSADGGLIHRAETPGKFVLSDWMWVLSLLVVLLGLVGNSLVLWLLGFRIQRNPFSVYILSLAGADALFLWGHFVFYIDRFAGYFHHIVVYEGVINVTPMSYCVRLSLLAALSMERCLAVHFPTWYQCHCPKHTSAVVCAGLWALTSLFWLADFAVCFKVLNAHFTPIIQVVWFVHFTPMLCGSSLSLLTVQCSSQRRQPPRLYLLVLLMFLVFLLCGLAQGIENIMQVLGLHTRSYWSPSLLTCVNSSVNPLVYFFLGILKHRRGGEPLSVLLQRVLVDEQDLGAGERNTPPHQQLETSL